MLAAPALRGGLLVRSAGLVLGLALFSLGIVLLLEAELGLAPWDVLSQGVAERTPLTFGIANMLVALGALAVAWRLRARIGAGTIANAILIGLFVEAIVRSGVLEGLSGESLAVRSAALVLGIAVIGAGSGLYIGAGMGAGPRDSLMLVLSLRTRSRIGVVRMALEISVTVAGLVLGGTVGVGTLAFALGIGPALEAAFWLLDRSPLSEGEVPSAA